MANIQFGGVASGLNTNALIEGLVKLERRSIDLLKGQQVRFQAQLGIFATLGSSLSSLKSAAQALSLSTDFHKRAAATSDATVLTAAADSTAQLGSYTITVSSLAKAKSLQSTSYTSTADVLGTGTLTIAVGGTNTDIVIDATNNTLTGLKEAINNSGAAVTASIVNVGAGTADYRLVVQSKNTGTANAVTISGTLNGGSDPFAGGGDLVQAASDAEFTVNGLVVQRSSNTVSDVMPGVTVTLLKDGGASSTVTVSSDTEALKGSIRKFVDAYNAVMKIANDQFKLDAATGRQGALAGDPVLRGISQRLRAAVSAAGGNGASFTHVSDIGISFQKDGSLTLDDAKLTTALTSDPDGVKNLFISSQNGIGKRVPEVVDAFISLAGGALSARQTGINASIASLEKKIAREEQRIATFEKNLVNQFTALEKLVSQFNQQSQFLSQRLAFLSPTTPGTR